MMDIEELRAYCLSQTGATEDVKWGEHLAFSVGDKMFCVTDFASPLRIKIKVADDEFDELCSTESIEPSAYIGRYKWITVDDVARFTDDEWRRRIRKSYELVRDKLPKRVREGLC